MRQYVVYRHGWNAANQDPARGLPEKMAVARVWADDADDACRRAAPEVTLVGGQRLSAEPADELDAKESDLNVRPDSLIAGQDAGPGATGPGGVRGV